MQFSHIEEETFASVQKKVVRQARHSDLIALVLNTISEGVMVIDAQLKIRYHNSAAENLLALPDDLEKVKISQYLPSVDWAQLLVDGTWQSSSRRELQVFYPKKRIVQFYLVPHEIKGVDATIILQDVTDEAVRQTAYIEEERLRMVGLLAAGVAHEIGNPLNSISLHLQLLKRTILKGDIDANELLELLSIAQNEVTRLDHIIREFLAAIRPSKPKLSPTQLQKVLCACLRVMELEIKAHELHLFTQIPDITPEINIDAAQVQQLLTNLIKNAIESSRPGGRLDISCSFDQYTVDLKIADTGIGIAPEELSKIFDPFHTTKSNGTGLGLMVVQRVMREHGAELCVDSTLEVGTTFTLKFPIPGRKRMPFLPPAFGAENECE